ncbi:MAG: nicotinic acid mononucleotide adenyltransferase [Flavobacteriaceae bacterium]|nr:MAG: nicotinic acid mononucleotide adenyltransferase [Flavobacteriaceae bacterium]
MKKILASLVICVLMTMTATAQNIEPTFEKQGDLVKATYYHDNGMVKEVGFFKDDKLHDKWIHYNEKGKIKIVALYKNGMKEGKWYMVGEESVKEITYKSNKVVAVKEVDPAELSFI